MAYFRKKPVVIEAMQIDGTYEGISQIIEWVNSNTPGFDPKDDKTWGISSYYGELKIRTLEGTMTAQKDDWIIKGVKGEFYPCKPDVFRQTYEMAVIDGDGIPGNTVYVDRENIAAYIYKCFGTWKENSFWDLSEVNRQGWLEYTDDIIKMIQGLNPGIKIITKIDDLGAL